MTDLKMTDKCPVCDCFNWKIVAVALVIVTSILAINWYFNYFPSPQSYDEVRVQSYIQGFSWNGTNVSNVQSADTFEIRLLWSYGYNESWVLTSYPETILTLNNADNIIDFDWVEHGDYTWHYNYTAFSFTTKDIGQGELIFERFINNVYQDNYKVKIIVVGDLLWE